MVGGTPSHNMTPRATGKGGTGGGGGGIFGSRITFGLRSGENRLFIATSAYAAASNGTGFGIGTNRGTNGGPAAGLARYWNSADSRLRSFSHSWRSCQVKRPQTASSTRLRAIKRRLTIF